MIAILGTFSYAYILDSAALSDMTIDELRWHVSVGGVIGFSGIGCSCRILTIEICGASNIFIGEAPAFGSIRL